MKFLCDRCKTRYSIADERVRGKILKIRCKNCANVITVREGMEEPAAEVKTPVPSRPSQRAAIAPGAGVGGRPLEAAFATAMSSPQIKVPASIPPAALEEEWYVSIDGVQSGPFALAQAQAWVGGRNVNDDLYCWSEGFDDWLPVEKVSHFRGLRGYARQRTEPPRMPDSGRHLRAPIDQSEPKPLFAATLAALEAEAASAPTRVDAPPIGDMLRANKTDPRNGRATPAPGNGRASRPGLPATGIPRAGAPPLPGTGPIRSIAAAPTTGLAPVATPSKLAAAPAPATSSAQPASSSISSLFAKSPAAAPAPAPANGANGATARPMFDGGALDDDSAPADALAKGAARGGARADDDEVDDLAIGEVSRVVRIADLARPNQTAPVARRTPQSSAVARGTGAVQKYDQAALAASGDLVVPPIALEPPVPGSTESEVAQALLAPPHQRHTMVLVGGVGFVALIATLVIIFATRGGTEANGIGPSIIEGDSDLSGISMEVTVTPMPRTPTGSGGDVSPPLTGSGGRPIRPHNPNTGGNPNTGQHPEIDRSGLGALNGDDVVAMSQRMSTGPRRCYEQAKKKDPFLDVKRLRAIITVDKAGVVSRVELLDHANAQLDGCLSSAIGRWKFRENSEGLTSQVSFAFMSS